MKNKTILSNEGRSTDRDYKIKQDSGKPEYRLIPPKALLEVAKVLTFGSIKYEPHSWVRVESYRFLDAAYRHLEHLRMGELIDPDSGVSHLAHAITNLMFLLERQADGKLDDLGLTHNKGENDVQELRF